MLLEQAQAGYTQLLTEVIINSDYAAADQAGFQQAWSLYLVNESKIINYRKGTFYRPAQRPYGRRYRQGAGLPIPCGQPGQRHEGRMMSKAIMPLLLIISVMLIVLLQFGFIFLLLALLPSLVALFIDRDAGKPTFKIVLACNFAATLPSLVPMLEASDQNEALRRRPADGRSHGMADGL